MIDGAISLESRTDGPTPARVEKICARDLARQERALFHANLEALGRRYPELAARMRGYVPNPGYRRVLTAAGQFDLIDDWDGYYVPWYDVAAPVDEAREYWAERTLQNPALMVFLGLDLGYRVFSYLVAPHPSTVMVLLVETDLDAFYHLLHIADIAPVVGNPTVHLLVGMSESEISIALRKILGAQIRYTLIKATHIEGDSRSYARHVDYYKRFLINLRDTVQALLLNAGNAPHDSFIGLRHMLLNLETIARAPGMKSLFGRFGHRPAVIVATGPSLDRNHHLLPELQNNAVIISVDASFKFLLRNGVKPHFVVCLERVPGVAKFFDELQPEACRDSVQVAVPVVMPEVYDVYPGPKAMLYRTFSHFNWLENDKGTLATGPSSANFAFKMAEALGCDPIILVGQDLAYADDGATHASAAHWGRTSAELAPDRMQTFAVRGNLVPEVRTHRGWESFRRHYVADIAAYNGLVINATEGGAYIDGTEVMTLRDAIDVYAKESFPVREQIRDGLRMPGEREATAFLDRLKQDQIPTTLEFLDDATTTVQELARRMRRAEAAGEPEPIARLAHEALQFYGRLFTPGGFFYDVAAHVVQPAFIQTMIEHHDIPNRFCAPQQINTARLALHAKFLEDAVKILGRLRDLYADPLHTMP